MSLPKVAIVGRPNVGKSSVFNWLARRRIAIVDPTAGVTRDRLATIVHADGRQFELIDTGGMGIQDKDDLTGDVEKQIEVAIDEADVILFVVDCRDGPMPLDEEVARRLRSFPKPVILAVNKCDTPDFDSAAMQFHKYGYEPLLCLSALQNRNRPQLLELIKERLPEESSEAAADVHLKLAIVGRRNTGKSTFINSLAEEERTIVSEVPGTTRDSVDVRFERDGKTFIAIDTAGVRKKKSIADSVEFYSLHRAERSIRRADVVLLFLDAERKISRVDKQLTEYILENHKPAIFVVNKWDLLHPLPTGKFADYLRDNFRNLDYVPIAFITAKKSKNVQKVLNLAQAIHKQASARVSTSDVNRVLRRAIAEQEPPLRQSRRPRIFYATQVAANPPTIVLFTNGPSLFEDWYLRYLLKAFRDHLPFSEVPIKLHLRHHRRGDLPGGMAPVDEHVPVRKKSTPVGPKPAGRAKTRMAAKKHAKPALWKDV